LTVLVESTLKCLLPAQASQQTINVIFRFSDANS